MHTSPSPLREGITVYPQRSPELQVYALWPTNPLPLPDLPCSSSKSGKGALASISFTERQALRYEFSKCIFAFLLAPAWAKQQWVSHHCIAKVSLGVLPAPALAKAPSSFLNPARCVFWLIQALAGFCSFHQVRYASHFLTKCPTYWIMASTPLAYIIPHFWGKPDSFPSRIAPMWFQELSASSKLCLYPCKQSHREPQSN